MRVYTKNSVSGVRVFAWMCVSTLFLWIGTKTYFFLFTHSAPTITVRGLLEGDHCSGDVACSVHGDHVCKVRTISIMLDDKPLLDNYLIGKSFFSHPFTINTRVLHNGQHSLRIELVDSTWSRNKALKEYTFYVDNIPLQAAFVRQDVERKIFQGRTLHLQFQVNKPLKNAYAELFSQQFPCFPESDKALIYEAFIPIDCEEKPNEYIIVVTAEDFVGNRVVLDGRVQIVPFPFKSRPLQESRITKEQLEGEGENTLSQKEFEELVLTCLDQSPTKKLWQGSFYVPTEMAGISAQFGSIRTTQQRGRYMHKAIDIMSPPRSVVWAPQEGTIIIKNRYAYSGNTVVIDHGCKIFSLFFHLDSFAKNFDVGSSVKKGNPIGTIGKTGYAAGYHLHWEMRINNIPVDPMQWTKQHF